MNQFLPRGCNISADRRIRTLVSEGTGWQIYLTNLDTYVLAVRPELYRYWVDRYSLPEGIFKDLLDHLYKVISTSSEYLISSLEKGPYPTDSVQVEAFSIAFKTTLDLFKGIDIRDAIYIEEYSLILPVPSDSEQIDNAVVYGRWLTAGVNVSIESCESVRKYLSWLPFNSLIRSAQLAGFEISPNSNQEIEEGQKGVLVSNSDDNDIEVASDNWQRFTLVGRPELEQFFNENIIDIVIHQKQYERMGIDFPGATILFGPPGCGKTYAVDRLVEYLGWQRFDIDSSSIASSYIHDTSKKISEVFKSAIDAAPSIVVIDEMEAFLTDRGIAGRSGMYHIEEVAEFLRRIPEAISKGVLVFAITNMIELIDPAFLRRGRFDHLVEVKMATSEEIEALLISKFSELPVDDTVDASIIANKLEGRPLSDVSFVIREAGRLAIKGSIEYINMQCFLEAIHLLHKRKEKPLIGFVPNQGE